ncbi:serine hydrolase [Duganella aceris]|uniref:Serine hydrolase n=1 Tax=Duganella aceris TaxID=2703883 RepID=A0ABX0FKN6_9BURK|nr:serine hydrolase [Duganella aceris]NGZ85143.1 serine hydrolase [Duganella aceris]
MQQRQQLCSPTRLACALLLVFGCAGPVAAEVASAVPHELQADVERVRKMFDVPGIAIAVVKDGKVMVARGFGVRKLGEAAPVDAQTLFEIAANSKAFTAAMLAMLVDEGKLGWDDPVTKHLPDFQMYDPYVTREITIRDLLSNRSGLGVGAGDLLWWPSSTFSVDEIIHQLRYIKPAFSFRSRYTYEYLPYIVAGKIVAEKRGQPWGDAVRERILTPLGMTRTTTSLAESAGVADQAAPHASIDGKLGVVKRQPMANAAAAMGISTSAEDIAKWMTLLLDAGKLAAPGADGKERRLFSAAQSREMWTPQTPIRVNEPKPQLAATRANFAASGLGFELNDYKGVKLASHRGWQFGAYSMVVLAPSARLGIAIMTNAESGPALNALRYRLLDHYLGLPPSDWIAAVGEAAAASREQEPARGQPEGGAKAPPSLARAGYDGEYRDPWYGGAVVKTVGGKQLLSFSRTPDMTGELEHLRHDTFIVRWQERSLNADAYVTFSLNPDGGIERMRLAPLSDDTDTSFDFADLVFTPVRPAPAR